MLRRRSIRTKLIVALALLSAIVLLLALSGFWGLYGYQQLVNAIRDRAEAFSHARKLNECAHILYASNEQILEMDDDEGMLDPLNLKKKRRLTEEDHRYEFAIENFDVLLGQYRNPIANYNLAKSGIDLAHYEEPSFIRIREAFAEIDPLDVVVELDFRAARASLSEPLEQLVITTDAHASVIDADITKLTHELDAHYRTWTSMAWICAALALSMVGILIWALNSLVVKPFRTLLDGSRLVAGGQFDHRIDLGTGDELSELAIAMNEMTDRFQGALNKVNSWCTDLDQQVRDRTREVIQNEQLASVGFLAAGVAHEINNPLATIAWSAESLESRVSELIQLPSDQRIIDEELYRCLSENLRRIEDEAYRCKGITENLLDFSRLSEVRRAPTNLVDLVRDVIAMVSNVGKYRCKTIQVHGGSEVVAHVNPKEIRQVVLNLVTNALESVDTDGAVDIHIETDGVSASITVSDNGCGMNEEVLKHLFEPFFTRRRDGTGTGLGLSITYRIVSQHGGSLIAHSDGDGCGSRMEILLPVEPADNETTQSPHALGLTHESYEKA